MAQSLIQPTQIDLDTDGTLAANSDSEIPGQEAVKAYVDANADSGGISGTAEIGRGA